MNLFNLLFKNKIIGGLSFIILFSFIFSSCSNRSNTLFYLSKKKNPKVPVIIIKEGNVETNEQSFYQKILPGDVLSLRNLQNETQVLGYSTGLNVGTTTGSNYLVEPDSTVVLPFLNKVKLGGLYLPEAEAFLNESYAKELLKNPLIKIQITNLKVTMMGEFGRVGNFPLSPNKSYLTDLIGEAGGLNARANPKKIRIIRGDLKNPQVIQINLGDLKSLADDRLYLQNNDIIYAETRNSFKFLDQISSTRNIIGILVSVGSAYILINTITR